MLAVLPHLNLAHLPTPIEYLQHVSARLGGPRILVKRDDQTGLAFGGNKTRKLEFLLADARAQGAKTLITAGAVQSNHCRQTAAAAAAYGLDCILVLAGEPPKQPSGNFLLDQLLGAEIIWGKWETRHRDLQDAFEHAQEAGRRPYLVPYGGSNAIGAAAYAAAIREMLEQNTTPDWIVFASSSGGTQAGLVAGAALYGFDGKILGISIDEPENVLKERVAALASDVAAHLGSEVTFSPEEILVNAAYAAPGYGVLTDRERRAIRLFAQTEGLLLDPVYTGRAAAGLLDLIHQGFFGSNDTVLFWHTGGTPGLFANKYRNL